MGTRFQQHHGKTDNFKAGQLLVEPFFDLLW